jgi:DNA-binding SARP family transcriptional activator
MGLLHPPRSLIIVPCVTAMPLADSSESADSPAGLLEQARALEPWMRYDERAAVLDRLQRLLDSGQVPLAPPGREWRFELLAERAIDVGRVRRPVEARVLAARVLQEADPSHEIALARALLADAQALAWIGTDSAAAEAKRVFSEAAQRFALLGRRDWQGSALVRWGYSACYQQGQLREAEALIREALETWGPDSQRRSGALVYYADVLIDLGELERVDLIFDEAYAAAKQKGDRSSLAEITWGRARTAAGRGDARATERLLREAEREAAGVDWFRTNVGLTFLLEAAEMLDRVGLVEQGQAYLECGRARVGDENEEVMQARAILHARSGDPTVALNALQDLARPDWLEKRHVWHHTLLAAWATFRAGREGAGGLAARAFDRAVAGGGIRVAQVAEPDLTAALAPMAERAGSANARDFLLADRGLMVRLFGAASVIRADGSAIALPAGKPGELVRMLGLHEHGLPTEVVLEAFFPDATPWAARHRLRQILLRLPGLAGELVIRDGEILRLVPSWVDVREFLAAAERVRIVSGPRAVRLAYAALALHTGLLLPADEYAGWAEEIRADVQYRYLKLLDMVVADAIARGSHKEALTALDSALAAAPDDTPRQAARVQQLRALGHDRAAEYVIHQRTDSPGRSGS